MKPTNRCRRHAALLGLGFDARDGHTRITRGDNYLLCGGSQQTHEVMQEAAVKINERLDRTGRRLEEVSPRELGEIVRKVIDKAGHNGPPPEQSAR